VLFFSLTLFTGYASAQDSYSLLAPIPTITQTAGTPISFSVYLKGVIVAIVGLSIVFAVIMTLIGGIEYVAAAVPSAKSGGKKKILEAIGGLLIAIFSYLLLITINPDLTMIGLDLWLVTPSEKIVISDGFTPPPNKGTGSGATGTNPGAGSSGSGRCEVIDDRVNPCSPERLGEAGFSNTDDMSIICNYESAGGNAARGSGVDCCGGVLIRGGPSCQSRGLDVFSWGLFQINLTSTDTEAVGWGVDCRDAFKGTNYRCTVVNRELYNRCVALAQDPKRNAEAAKYLYDRQGKCAWACTVNKCGVGSGCSACHI